MAAPLPHSNDSDTHFTLQLDDHTPPSTGSLEATPQTGGSLYFQSRSHSSSPSPVRRSVSPEQVMSLSAKPTSKSGQISREKLSITSNTCHPTSFQNVHQSLTKYFRPALVLQNSGSVARDHLASERTFLAYVRTSLGMAGAGVALLQLFTMSDLVSKSTGVPLPAANQRLQKFATPLSLSAFGMALIILGIGVFRYFLIQQILPENKFPATRLPILLISFCLGAFIVIAFGALLAQHSN